MQNKDGRYGSRATQKDLADCYGSAAVFNLSYLSEVTEDRWEWYVSMIVDEVIIAAHHGRKSLGQRSK